MEITVTDIPNSLKTIKFSPRIILSERTTVEYLLRMKEYIFGNNCCTSAEQIGIDVFDLVFIGDKSFNVCCEYYLVRVKERDKDIIKTALLLKKMYNGEYIRISSVMCKDEKAYVKEPEYSYLNLINDDIKFSKRKVKKQTDNGKKLGLNKYSRSVLESVRLAAVKYGMKNALQYKELIDKYNFRRFSGNLKLNNRPASLESITSALAAQKDKCLSDLSDPKNRINFTALFAITYGGFKLSDLYAKNTVFDVTGFEKEKKLGDLSDDLINIIFNGNGIEIANMFVHIISVFSQTELPEVNMKDLGSIMDNYSIYYAASSLASVCEGIFKYEGLNNGLQQYLKKHTIENYWTSMDRLMLMKQYSVIVAFCTKLAKFDPVLYREDPEYQGEILYSFERAEKFSKELSNIE